MISFAGCSRLTMPAIWPARKQPVFSSPSTAARRSAPRPYASSSSSEMLLYSRRKYYFVYGFLMLRTGWPSRLPVVIVAMSFALRTLFL